MNTKTITLSALMTASATSAFAHAGHHQENGIMAMVDHMLASPFHLAAIVLALTILGVAGVLVRKHLARQAAFKK